MNNKFNLTLFTLFVCLFLSACKTTQLDQNAVFDKSSPKGLVVLSITQESPVFYSDAIIAYSRNNAGVFESHRGFNARFIDTSLLQNEPISSDFENTFGKVFVAELEPNDYNVEWIKYLFKGFTKKQEHMVMMNGLKPFTIKPGQITYLGEFSVKDGSARKIPNAKVVQNRARDLAAAKRKYPNINFH